MNLKLRGVAPELALKEWDKVLGPMLEPCLPYAFGRVGLEHWKENVRQGLANVMCVWAPEEKQILATLYIERVEHPSGKRVMSVAGCGGSHVFEWAPHLQASLEEHARKLGCDQLEVTGRRGWGRFLHGMRETTTYVKELQNVH